MGTGQFVDGAILFVGGQIAMHVDCCCGATPGDPCPDCGGAQPDAVVTVTAGCNDPCDDSAELASPFVFASYGEPEPGTCFWTWEATDEKGRVWTLEVDYEISSSPFYVGLTVAGASRFDKYEATVDCNGTTGALSGSVILDKTPWCTGTCTTATVTLGG